MANNLSNNFCHCCLMGANECNDSEPLQSMKDNSFVSNNETITFLHGYLDINNCSIEDLSPNISILDLLICELCGVQLESAFVFRELCRQAAITWRSKYSVNQIIKCEEADKVDNDSESNIIADEAVLSNVETEQVLNSSKKIPKAKKFSCPQCENVYSTKWNRKLHINTVHLKISYSCKMCPSVYTTNQRLNYHIQSCHENTSNICNTCGKSFKSKNGLSGHKKSKHLGILYKCNKCPKIFKSASALLVHKKRLHLGVVYKCKHCPKTYTVRFTQNSLKKCAFKKAGYFEENKFINLSTCKYF